ncbi:hypothetical protein Tco_1341329, partial [Tanacetum coccineum]
RKDTESCYQNSRSRGTEPASKKHHNKRASSRRTEALSESEDNVGGHWKSRSKKQRSNIEDGDLSQPWVCEETGPFTPRIRYFDLSKRTRMASHVKTYDRSEDPKDHLKSGKKHFRHGNSRRLDISKISRKEVLKISKVGHNTDECIHLKRQIEELLQNGKLSHVIKELKQNSGKDQPKTNKKEETSNKDKALVILMVGNGYSRKRQKNKAKNDKTEHENEKSVKRSQSQSQSQPRQSQVKVKVKAKSNTTSRAKSAKPLKLCITRTCIAILLITWGD